MEPQSVGEILSTYAFKLGTGEIWGVPSRSEPDQIRIVVFFEEGTVVCSCPAKLSCRHVRVAQDHRSRMHKPSRESAEQLFGDKLTQRFGEEKPVQFPDKQYAIRKKDAPDYYLSDEASVDVPVNIPSSNLTAEMHSIAFYSTVEMARIAWKTFFKMEDGEVVRWSPESIEVVSDG